MSVRLQTKENEILDDSKTSSKKFYIGSSYTT